MFDKEKNGKRAGKKTQLSLHQKILIVIAVLLAIALGLVIAGQSLFVHPIWRRKRSR